MAKMAPKGQWLFAFACLGITAVPAFAQTPSLGDMAGSLSTAAEAPAVVYVARDFLTMDPSRPHAEAVAIRDGKFIAVGTRSQALAAAGPGARVDDTLAGKTVIAGFIEQHVHPVLAALTMNSKVISIEDWDAIDGFSPAVRDASGYEARLKSAINVHRAKDPTKPFITWGYHDGFHGKLTRAMLDKLAGDTPVIVWHRSCHAFTMNSAALKLMGVDAALVNSFSASAKAQVNLGEGLFFEQGALALLPKVTPLMATPAQFRHGLEYTVNYYHRNGITLACEPGGFPSKPLQDMINAVYSDDKTPFNHCFMGDGKTFAAKHSGDPAAMVRASEAVLDWGRGRTWYLPKQVKFFTDGAIYSQLMQMKDGYTDGHKGAWIMDPPLFDEGFQAFWDAGYQIHVHNNGDGGMAVLLASLEKAMARNPRVDHRAVIVHFGFASEDQVKRWMELGGIVSANPYYVTALAGQYAKVGVGPARSANMVPLSWVADKPGALSFHSDMPMAPAKPLQLVWAGVNRFTAEGPVSGPQHRASIDRAMRAITVDAAYSIQQEKHVGSIVPGKDANLTVLESDPYTTAPEKLKDIKVWGTMLEGRLQPVGVDIAASGAAPGTVAPDVQLAITNRLAEQLSHDHSLGSSIAVGGNQ
jgi:predicted amidohydrolase YtcJ